MKNETTGFRAASGKNDIANGKRSIKRTVQGNTKALRDADEPATAGKKSKMEEKITPEYETLPKQAARRAEQEKPQSEQIEAGGTPNRHKQ